MRPTVSSGATLPLVPATSTLELPPSVSFTPPQPPYAPRPPKKKKIFLHNMHKLTLQHARPSVRRST